MRCSTLDKDISLETFYKYIIEQQKSLCNISRNDILGKTEKIVVVEYIKTLDDLCICQVTLCKTCHLVEERQSITHTTIRFLRYNAQCFIFGSNTLFLGYILQMVYYI